MLFPKILITEYLLQRRLGIIKRSVDRHRENVIRTGAGHLPFLQRRDATIGIENENRRARLTEQTVNRRGPRITGGRAEHVNRLPA